MLACLKIFARLLTEKKFENNIEATTIIRINAINVA